jgi:hypothetical protein
MKTHRTWHGVRMRQAAIGADPDEPPCLVTLPTAWDDGAAAGLAAIAAARVPVQQRIHLAAAAAAWIDPVEHAAQSAGLGIPIGERLHRLLLLRSGAPSEEVWAGRPRDGAGFVLNLPAFLDADGQFDAADFAEAIETAVMTLHLLVPGAATLRIGMADLFGLLAALGIEYGSAAARDIARALAAILRGRADAISGGVSGARAVLGWPDPPAQTALLGLAEAARAARLAAAQAGPPRHRVTTAITAPDAADAILGVETGGIAPAFSPLNASGCLSKASRSWLAVSGLTAEEALAMVLAGGSPFPSAGAQAHAAMHDAIAPTIQSMPPRPVVLDGPAPRASRRELPGRRTGYTQRALVGGHRIFLRTGEYDDGSLGEVSVALLKESPAFRGLMDSFAAAVSIGLQHGVPLDAFVEAFTLTRFGPGGVVEGDPAVRRATSLIDYTFRHLASNYLGRRDMPEADIEETDLVGETSPLLPMDLPAEGSPRARRRGFRVVAR